MCITTLNLLKEWNGDMKRYLSALAMCKALDVPYLPSEDYRNLHQKVTDLNNEIEHLLNQPKIQSQQQYKCLEAI